MRKPLIAVLTVALALTLVGPVVTKEWIEKPLLAAAERVLTTMPADFYQIDPLAAERLMETARPLVLDVREKAEWDAERIAGAVHVPIRELPKALDKLPDSRGAPIVVYCAVGVRGAMATTVLRMWGYTNVRNLRGGLGGWKAANLPVVK
ncbi:MAG: rhodanese-like domain-containing protein [Armatimonadota bacterium]|nr:rhodanese-like domain-containing protein [Armatimonadota bacterium]MDR7485495.1 rhodanese-like domain-containing protein [Armatimonadota bacterium]MDR7533040.1 rhodanese-like domain-containing protein [Armatimonadota bacterium]MDR7536788.1 rhodanese-like domain-containing protein [Armatimonadota bacterium]